MLAGPVGAGVTTVARQLHQQVAESDVYILPLEITSATNLDQLLQSLNDAIDQVFPSDGEVDTDLLIAFQQKIDALAKLKRKILLSIDNADFLQDDALQSLLNLIQASQNEISILLGGSTDFVSRVSKQVIDPTLAEIVHHEIISPFSRLETEEFIQLSFVRGSDFSAKQLTDIYLKSQGYPGLILQLTNEMIKSGKIILNGKNKILPVPHIIGIAVLLTAIVTVSSWQYFSDETLLEEDELSDQNVALTILTDEGVVTPQVIVNELEQHGERAQQLQQEIANLAGQIEAQELLIDTVREESNGTETEHGTAIEIALPLDQIIEVTASSATDVELLDQMDVTEQGRSSPLGANEQTNDLDQTNASAISDAGTVIAGPVEDKGVELVIKEALVAVKKTESQVVIATDKDFNPSLAAPSTTTPAVDLVIQQPEAIKRAVEPAVVIEAQKSVEQSLYELTAELKKNIVASTLEISEQVAVRSVVVQENSISATSTPVKAPAKSPVTISSIKAVNISSQVERSSARLDQQSVKSWPESGFTLQLLGTRSKAGVTKFLTSMPNSEKMRHFTTTLKDKPWHVVVYGQYPSRARASAAKSILPAKLKALKPWVKSIKSVKSDINK
jgi:septal ring-binding cell division protein DamX/type II secretory pathway predicted ATPase ExeA